MAASADWESAEPSARNDQPSGAGNKHGLTAELSRPDPIRACERRRIPERRGLGRPPICPTAPEPVSLDRGRPFPRRMSWPLLRRSPSSCSPQVVAPG